MFRSEIIYLLKEEKGTNSIGDVIETPEPRLVYADKKSIRQSEFYQAQANDLKPELTFEIYSFEYEDESKLIYKEKTYKIIRTFEKGDDLELICEGVVNSATT